MADYTDYARLESEDRIAAKKAEMIDLITANWKAEGFTAWPVLANRWGRLDEIKNYKLSGLACDYCGCMVSPSKVFIHRKKCDG
jgi:hypothetical protein